MTNFKTWLHTRRVQFWGFRKYPFYCRYGWMICGVFIEDYKGTWDVYQDCPNSPLPNASHFPNPTNLEVIK